MQVSAHTHTLTPPQCSQLQDIGVSSIFSLLCPYFAAMISPARALGDVTPEARPSHSSSTPPPDMRKKSKIGQWLICTQDHRQLLAAEAGREE